MSYRIVTVAAIVLLVPSVSAQQSSSPQPQQMPSAPCTTTAAPANASNTNSTLKLSDDTKKKIEQKRKWLQQFSPIQLPDPTIPQKPKAPPSPCPPVQPNTQVAPMLKLPADVSITLRCNPVIAPPKGLAGAPTGFTLPDPHAYGLPDQANTFEADNATPDMNAKTPCYALKVDPKTNKYFIAQ